MNKHITIFHRNKAKPFDGIVAFYDANTLLPLRI